MGAGALSELKPGLLVIVSLAVVTLMGMAVITGFKTTKQVTNATADQFTTGLAITAGFISVVVLALMGRTVMKLFN